MQITKKLVKNQHGFSSLVIVLLVAVLAGFSFIGYRAYKTNQKPADVVKTETASSQPEKVEEPVDPTADWKSYTSNLGKYKLKHPAEWYADVCDASAEDLALYLGPAKASRVVCNSEHVSQIIIVSTAEVPTESEQELGTNYSDKITKKVVVDGITGERQSGKLKVAEFGVPADTLIVRYFFLAPGRSYIANYVQAPVGDYKADNLDDFDLMVQKTLEFTK